MTPAEDINESAVQDALVAKLSTLGWRFIRGEDLDRQYDDALIESDVAAALIRLNPVIAERPERAEEVLAKLRAVLLAVTNDGLVATNEEMVAWLCGRRTHRFVGTDDFVPVRLVDLGRPERNTLVVSTEVTYTPGTEERRYDLVLWANGFPLVVGETKTPDSVNKSWLNGAHDIHAAYEVKTPGFFVPNVLSFATEGKDFRYGAVRQPPEMWLPWSRTTETPLLPGLASALRSAELLLAPSMLLDILRTYTLFSRESSASGGAEFKIIPRYPQVEAVEAIVARVRDPRRRRGLVWHHQGSGKTLLMAFAAAKIRQQADLDAPTILVVLDRLDIIEQTRSEFLSVGLPSMKVAETKDELRQLLRADDARGVIVTTIFRFEGAGLLNDRANIVVLVDEAHRTQEGRLGMEMREALPNAKFIGLTGSPISTRDRNTWATFGDPDDPGGVLNHYSVDRSIADGTTLPIHVETRLVDFHVDHAALDEAFAELAAAEGLDEGEAGYLSKRVSRVDQLMKAPARVKAVCEDIVAHYRAKLAPLGLKAQIVTFDRECCVLYHDAISALLHEREEATVVMTAEKADPKEWSAWDREREAENRIKDRFRDPADPLRLLIVTAKLLTGFNAPIEGALYLDKPLRAHMLFQAVCRTNRRWTDPRTGQEKLYGLVVDYVGLGQELAKAVAVADSGQRTQRPVEIGELIDTLAQSVATAMARFAGIDRTASGFEQLYAAQERLPDRTSRDAFAEEFLRAQGLFEFLSPDPGLRPFEVDYRWLARIYRSVTPTDSANLLLWHRLGAKTAALIHEHLTDVTLDSAGLETIAIDAGVFEKLRQLRLWPPDDPEPPEPPTIEEVIDRLEARLRAKLAGPAGSHVVWQSISARLEALRRVTIDTATASVDFLKQLLEVARDLVAAERADEAGHLDDLRVVDPDRGALTQILEEYAPADTPVIVENVVEQIDAIVRPIRGTGWQTSHPGDREVRRQLREVLSRQQLPAQGAIFDRAYAYIREHY
ncbi:MAG TPA: HsdR family type I site-specific deoxyribonuclease [Candidatus Micrarchaeia archaeon]|nr:HsdR family type I site-specific deoxyribonuclease [Candidatus Micrarchaeia archaeon]